jgi:hypothetical protein
MGDGSGATLARAAASRTAPRTRAATAASTARVREGRGAGSVGIAKALEVGRASVYRTLANDSDPEPADMSEENYTIVVAQPNPHSPWEWEVYRNGAPLPARLRKGDFRSEGTARAAGKMALLEFLAALSRENSRPLS